MIVQKNFLSKLREFGLNTYESKLWTALLSRGISTAGELSNIANVPRSRTYDVLESLEKKGFIIQKIGKPINYLAVPPEEVVERVKKKIEEEAETKKILLEELQNSSVLDDLNTLHKQGVEIIDPSDQMGYFKDRKLVHIQIESMIKNATESVILMTTKEGIMRKKKFLIDVFKRTKDKKLDIKIAVPITKENIDDVKELSKYAEIRHIENESRYCIVDSDKILFMILHDSVQDPSYDCGIWAQTKPFLSSIKSLFEIGWDKMTPLNKVKL